MRSKDLFFGKKGGECRWEMGEFETVQIMALEFFVGAMFLALGIIGAVRVPVGEVFVYALIIGLGIGNTAMAYATFRKGSLHKIKPYQIVAFVTLGIAISYLAMPVFLGCLVCLVLGTFFGIMMALMIAVTAGWNPGMEFYPVMGIMLFVSAMIGYGVGIVVMLVGMLIGRILRKFFKNAVYYESGKDKVAIAAIYLVLGTIMLGVALLVPGPGVPLLVSFLVIPISWGMWLPIILSDF